MKFSRAKTIGCHFRSVTLCYFRLNHNTFLDRHSIQWFQGFKSWDIDPIRDKTLIHFALDSMRLIIIYIANTKSAWEIKQTYGI